jgi:hypothetical protein
MFLSLKKKKKQELDEDPLGAELLGLLYVGKLTKPLILKVMISQSKHLKLEKSWKLHYSLENSKEPKSISER